MTRSNRQGFTLIEILVVVFILLLLTAILVPVYSNAKRSAKMTACGANESQILKATMLYAADYDDRLPYALSAFEQYLCTSGNESEQHRDLCKRREDGVVIENLLTQYTREVELFRCPEDNDLRPGETLRLLTKRNSSYNFSRALSGGVGIHSFEGASDQAYLWDFYFFHGGTDATSARVNVGFLDGHVKRLTWDDLHRNYTEKI